MGAGASASSQASLFTAEQKAEIKKQVGVSTSKKWQDASDVADLESARKEIARLRGLVANVVLDASTSRAAGDGAAHQRGAVRDVGFDDNEPWKPIKHAKSGAIETMLREVFRTNKLFEKCLTPSAADEASALVDAFEARTAPAGEVIIKQGDVGDYFYVVRRLSHRGDLLPWALRSSPHALVGERAHTRPARCAQLGG